MNAVALLTRVTGQATRPLLVPRTITQPRISHQSFWPIRQRGAL
jgi:hypothetical protein